MRNSALSAAFVIAAVFSWATRTEAQQIQVLQQLRMQGTLRATAAGEITVEDDQGQVHRMKIQEKDDPGVSLAGAQVVIDMPAEVSVTGELPLESLEEGSLVRFAGKLDRRGNAEGSLAEIELLAPGSTKPDVTILEPADDKGGFAEVQVIGEVGWLKNERLMVNVPPSEATRDQSLIFPLEEDAIVKFSSDDYRRAPPGAKVTSLEAWKLSTGDVVVRKLTAVAEQQARSHNPLDDALAKKYRHLSDEPQNVREIRRGVFLLRTDISDRQAQILLDKLERMFLLVSRYYGHPPKGMYECYVVNDLSRWPQGSLDAYAAEKVRRGEGVTVSLSLGADRRAVVYSCDDHGVVQHEAVHAYQHQTFGSTGPTWYAEGMAELGQYWKEGQLAVDISPVAIDYLKNAPDKKGLLEIVAAGQITGDSWRAYAWRWALCHLLAHNPNYAGRFKELGIGMMRESPNYSFEAVYGPVAKEISFEYDQFLGAVDNGYRADLCAWQWGRKFVPLHGDRRGQATVLARGGWQAANVQVEQGVKYDVAALGAWKMEAEGSEVSADGDTNGRGRLVAAVMHDYQLSQPIPLAARTSFTAPASGDVYIRCQDDFHRLADNDGKLNVHFRRAP
ncbi:MAG: basic secretory family protein [Planctomycetes bacterium]|nr:basic secretory family protein [Planctomycetota bacterium]